LNCVASFFDALGALNVAAQHWPFSDWICAVICAVTGSDRGSVNDGMLSPFALNWVFALPASPTFSRILAGPSGVRSARGACVG
jgi:phosphate/sulfate permease